MLTVKRVTFSVSTFGFAALVMMGLYNSLLIKNDSFMAYDSGVKFVKRLDELNGKVTVGRLAASTQKWSKLAPKKIVKKKQIKKVATIEAVVEEAEEELVEPSNIPEPAIKGDLDLTVSNVFFKGPLKQGSFSGSARTVDGVIEEIFVSLPNGDQIEINTRDRMVGNVFQYEDSVTRDIRSGMLYEVKPGTYMVTLTNDTKFKGARIEFTSQAGSEIAYSEDYYQSTQNWGMDNQNNQDTYQDEYSNNQPIEDQYYETPVEKAETSGFNFNPQG